MEFVPIEQIRQQLMCPFCIGNEDETPAAAAVYRHDGRLFGTDEDTTQWTVRVVPNKFPSFRTTNIPSDRKPTACTSIGPYKMACMPGEQELIVSTSRHVCSFSELNDPELLTTFVAYQDRLRFIESLDHVQHAMLFMNCRSTAGASLSHIHTQLIGSPILSERLRERFQRNQEHFAKEGQPLIQALAEWESEQKVRMIFESDHFYVFCPYASRFPFQIWMVPKHSSSHFVDAPAEMRDELARNCRWLITQIEELMEGPGYNVLLHHAPVQYKENDHWYFEILPRLTRAAGFEWGTDIWVNPVAPESAAKRLRLK